MDTLSVTVTRYGEQEGAELQLVTLQNGAVTVTVTNLGATITAIHTPDREGIAKNITAGFEDLFAYRDNSEYFGCIVGRYANRISNGRFVLDGREYRLAMNDAPNHLHGGINGFHRKVWHIAAEIRNAEQAGVVMEYRSVDGEEGYPGNLDVTVTYILDRDNRLHMQYSASTDKSTPVNLTNHSYFNLSGFEQLVTDHILHINALYYTEKSSSNVPTGRILPLEGTPLDFQQPKRIGDDIERFPQDGGFDHNYVLQQQDAVVPAATLHDQHSGRLLRVFTSQPGMQLYTANLWDGSLQGPQGKPYVKHGAVALETQAFPDSPNHASFPDTILEPGNTLYSTTIFEFGVR